MRIQTDIFLINAYYLQNRYVSEYGMYINIKRDVGIKTKNKNRQEQRKKKILTEYLHIKYNKYNIVNLNKLIVNYLKKTHSYLF